MCSACLNRLTSKPKSWIRLFPILSRGPFLISVKPSYKFAIIVKNMLRCHAASKTHFDFFRDQCLKCFFCKLTSLACALQSKMHCTYFHIVLVVNLLSVCQTNVQFKFLIYTCLFIISTIKNPPSTSFVIILCVRKIYLYYYFCILKSDNKIRVFTFLNSASYIYFEK